MAIALRTSATNTANASTLTIAKAALAGLSDGDFVLIHYTCDTDLAWTTVEAGWTKVDEKLTTAGRDLTSGYFWKLMVDVSGEPATWTFGHGATNEKVLAATVWTDVDSVSYLDVLETTTSGTNDSTPDGLDITTTVDGAMIVSSCHLADPGDVSAIVGGAPAELALADYDIIFSSDTAFCAVAYLLKSSLGVQSIGSWTNTNDNGSSEWHCRTLSLNPPGVVFADIRQDIIDGLDSAQSEGTGWDIEVKGKIPVTDVVRTNNTVVTITLSAAPDYDITAQETIEVTVPATAVDGAGEIVATPTFTVDTVVGEGISIPVAMYHYRSQQ